MREGSRVVGFPVGGGFFRFRVSKGVARFIDPGIGSGVTQEFGFRIPTEFAPIESQRDHAHRLVPDHQYHRS
jgi:hypothetical protein